MEGFVVSSIAALALGSLYLGLIVQVIANRRRHRIGFGDGDNKKLRGALRAQVNASEQIPLFLILLGLSEQLGVDPRWLGLIALLFLIGRLLHSYGMSCLVHRMRVLGTAVNLSSLSAMLLTLAYGLIG